MKDFPFMVGDRVKVIKSVSGIFMPGATGTVVDVLPDQRPPIGVQFDERVPQHAGHSCRDKCPRGYGRYGSISEFELLLHELNEEPSEELNSFITSFYGGDKNVT